MSVIVGKELKYWCDSLNVANLDDYEITVMNIIINHYADLMAAGGTANGKRANKFAEYVNVKKGICDKNLDAMSVGKIEDGLQVSSAFDMPETEPKGLNRHWIAHGRKTTIATKLDCCKMINALYGLFYFGNTILPLT